MTDTHCSHRSVQLAVSCVEVDITGQQSGIDLRLGISFPRYTSQPGADMQSEGIRSCRSVKSVDVVADLTFALTKPDALIF